jgi:hypothetical protein
VDPEPDADASRDTRYRFIEYEDEFGNVAVIQDEHNHRAWIQSTTAVPVRR